INAMAFPNGVVVITPELLHEIEFVEEFDFIFLHERSHIRNEDSRRISRADEVLKRAGIMRTSEYRSDAQPFWQMADQTRRSSPRGAIIALERLRTLEKQNPGRMKWDVAHGNIDDRILNLKSVSQILNFAGMDATLTPLPDDV